MFVILARGRQPTHPVQLYSVTVFETREQAENAAQIAAKSNIYVDYYVVEALSKHSARVEVNVTKP